MGVDKRGKDRGGCGECDCSDYEQPPGYGSSRCGYCECPPTRHQLLGYDKSARLTKPNDRSSSTDKSIDRPKPEKRVALSTPLFDDLPLAGSFPHDDWTKIDDVKLDKPSGNKPFLFDSSEPAEENTGPDDLPATPGPAVFSPASQPRQKKPDKVNRRENARAAAPGKRRGNSGDRGDSPPKSKGPSGGRPGRKKSAAVKCHNLDQIMSSHLADKRTAERIDAMFQNFDDDDSNELDKEECARLTGYILEQCGLQPDIIPSFVYDEAFEKYDDDGGGTITLQEFREFLMSHLKK